jgi:hypothetical protein
MPGGLFCHLLPLNTRLIFPASTQKSQDSWAADLLYGLVSRWTHKGRVTRQHVDQPNPKQQCTPTQSSAKSSTSISQQDFLHHWGLLPTCLWLQAQMRTQWGDVLCPCVPPSTAAFVVDAVPTSLLGLCLRTHSLLLSVAREWTLITSREQQQWSSLGNELAQTSQFGDKVEIILKNILICIFPQKDGSVFPVMKYTCFHH